MQAVMNLVWEKLLPALKAAPLPADALGAEKLNKRLARPRSAPSHGTAYFASRSRDLWETLRLCEQLPPD
jgi:hypothetical protein